MTAMELERPSASAPTRSLRRLTSPLATVLLASLWLLFAVAHLSHWRTTGKPTGLVFAVQELLLVGVFLTRRRPLATSDRPRDWLLAGVVTFTALFLRPTGHTVVGPDGVWLGLQVVAALAAIACVARLGRSFGVVAANRGVRSGGPYRLVRHPMYASYLVGQVAYLLGSFSPANLAIVVVAFAGQILRIGAEERVLRADEAYRRYCERVPYRLIPGLF